MKFYFSGISSTAEVELLQAAGATHILVDPSQAPLVAGWPDVEKVKDSGAYAAFAKGTPLPPWSDYTADAANYAWLAAPDVIGDEAATVAAWERVRGTVPNLAPVWHWGGADDLGEAAHRALLERYAGEAAPVVCIGGLVPYLRSRRNEKLSPEQRQAWNAERKATLKRLVPLCRANPGRFHILGLCWVPAIVELAEYLASGDSSLWVRAPARYGDVLFIHSKSGKLSQAPAGVLPEAKGWDRPRRCIESARTLQTYLQARTGAELVPAAALSHRGATDMAARKITRAKPAAAAYLPMDEATVTTVRTMLNDAVQAHIALLEAASDEGFAAAWEEAMRPTVAFWHLYLLLPLIAFPGELAPDQRHEPALLLAPALLAPTLAALAFAPGGLRFGLTTWQGQHSAASRLIGYRVTDDTNGSVLRLSVQPGQSIGGWTPLHRRTVQTLMLLFPFRAAELLWLPVGERWNAMQRVTTSLNSESVLFSEVLVVGGTVEQMGQTVKELVEAVAALACVPYGVPMFGYRWEIGAGPEPAIEGNELELVGAASRG